LNYLDEDQRHLKRAAERCRDGASFWPRIVTVHPTDRCNHACEWCWYPRSSHAVDIASTIAALDRFVSHGMDELVVSGGGEPLVHPDIDTLIHYVADIRGAQRRLYTNGSLIHKHPGIGMAFDYVRVSMDAGGARKYARAHGTSERSYDRILTSLTALSECGVDVGVSAVVRGPDEQTICQLLRDCERYGVPRLFLKPRMRGFAHEPMPSFVFELNSSKVEITLRMPFACSAAHRGSVHAPLPLSAMNILIAADSRLYPCCHLPGEEWAFGQVGGDAGHIIGGPRHQNVLQRYWQVEHPCWAHHARHNLRSEGFIPDTRMLSSD
jgi:organic radical activating enzyme